MPFRTAVADIVAQIDAAVGIGDQVAVAIIDLVAAGMVFDIFFAAEDSL